MEELLDEPNSKRRVKRPPFLVVLCILTWIGSAMLFVFWWREYAYASAAVNLLKSLAAFSPGGTAEVNQFYHYLNRQIFHALVQMTACSMSLAGAIAVWRLRKWGFYLYAAGELVSLLAAAWAVAVILKGGEPLLQYATVILFPAAFTTMYALNYKHLR